MMNIDRFLTCTLGNAFLVDKDKLPCAYEYAHRDHPLRDISEINRNTGSTVSNLYYTKYV